MMSRSLRNGTALSVLAMAGVLAGCATSGTQQSALGATAAGSKVGLAVRAQVAVGSGDFATAVRFAEQAVEHSPGQASFRAVLGNAYFGSGRFASAETAYRDSLSLAPAQPNVVLKLALAEIAQGKNASALADLEAAREYLDPADYGLALALAGRPADAVAVLGQAARLPGADARVRQNLALAHALAGDWTMARTIAEQDVPPEQLDSRIRQWMAMATPVRASDQVAALTGITPSADPGQPVRLALHQAQPAQRLAQAIPAPARQPESVAPRQPVQFAAPEPDPVEYVVPRPRPAPAPVIAQVPQATPVALVPSVAEPVDAVESSPPGQESVAAAFLHPAAAPEKQVPTSFEEKPRVADFAAPRARKPVAAAGRSSSVVQLGAYGSPQRVAAAWDQFARRYGALGRYTPVSARFSGPKGVVYRLSVKGFASAGEAKQLCGSLRAKGKNCFVRRIAGDSPVQFAAR